ncbi:MAG: membrane protein insertion efficiency factor YidD [Bacteroidetes bacterium]|nr:MAG: membrane protein insertion efficiency factor YidD [Bacteroidota bacterium]
MKLLHSLVIRFFLFLLKIYQSIISPFFPPVCRYAPSCSEYSKGVITKFGIITGSYYSFKRILSCHPWSKGGYDPIP